jgi:hypothetical protein
MEKTMNRTEKIINHINANILLFNSQAKKCEVSDLGVSANRRYLVKVYLYSNRNKEYVLTYTFTEKQYLEWFIRDYEKEYPNSKIITHKEEM